jgi:hypothetical protein
MKFTGHVENLGLGDTKKTGREYEEGKISLYAETNKGE